jgi:hypothetical protein
MACGTGSSGQPRHDAARRRQTSFGAEMIFSSIPVRRARRALVGLAAAAALAACGGGTSQFDPFVAERVLAFGDEVSLLTPDGRKYSVNATKTVTAEDGATTVSLDCAAQPNWVQSLASIYGFVFAGCNPDNVETPQAIMRATEGAKAADLALQIDAQVAAGGFRFGDIATVLAGVHDVIELYKQYPTRSEEELRSLAGERGHDVARQVNRMVDLDARVIIVTIPDLGLTPYALKQRDLFKDTDRAALLSRLASSFNEQLQLRIVPDGRFVGLVQADQTSQAMVRSPGSFGLQNWTTAVCLDSVALVDCSDKTLVENGTASNWMWADDLRPSFSVHQQIASLAIDRARNNPF